MAAPRLITGTDITQNERIGRVGPPISSSIYVLHKDWTKPLDRPNTVQEVIDGVETNTDFIVRLAVPPGATHMSPYWLCQYSAASNIGSVTGVAANISGATTYALRFYGRVAIAPTSTSFDPSDAGLSNAVKYSTTYGLWKPLMNVSLNVGANSTFWDVGLGGDVAALPIEVSATRRFIAQPFNMCGAASPFTSNLIKADTVSSPYATGKPPNNSSAAAAGFWDANFGTIPLRGTTEVIVVPEYFGSTPSVSYVITGGTTTAVDFCAIGASFH